MASQNGRSTPNETDERLANALGWFSIGLGLAEVLAPGGLARFIGIDDKKSTRTLLRTYGFREIGAGVGILSQSTPAGWLWGRVAGDLLDLASLGKAMAGNDSGRTKMATAAVLGVTALDVYCGTKLTRQSNGASGKVRATETIIIDKSPEELYRFWRDLRNVPQFMTRIESVEDSGGGNSHWTMRLPHGGTMEWDSEIIWDNPNERISWQAVQGSGLDHQGTVRFEPAPGGRGTMVRLDIQYSAPGGAMGTKIANLFHGDPMSQLRQDLRRFKQIMETGEVVHSDPSIHAGMHPGQPPESTENIRPRQTMQPSMA